MPPPPAASGATAASVARTFAGSRYGVTPSHEKNAAASPRTPAARSAAGSDSLAKSSATNVTSSGTAICVSAKRRRFQA